MLIKDYKKIIKKAGSFQLAILSGIFTGIELLLPFFFDQFHPHVFAVLGFVAAIGSALMRVISQKAFRKDEIE